MNIKAKEKRNGIVYVKALVKHIMLPYKAALKKGIKANFITYISAEVDGKIVFELSTSQFVSENPRIEFQFKGKKGQWGTMTWKDNLGKSKISKFKIK